MITIITKDKLVKYLVSIGWQVSSKMNGYAFKMVNHEGKECPLLLGTEKLFIKDDTVDMCFYYKQCSFEMLSRDTVSLFAKENKSVFINFYGERKK